ncbi:MAG: efflux RND transporter periplasmic adaptor subunit [Deltaproteobacteria bacterium]|nr:efflux RND transporter periplasmic adaptor subunit [Deltaproteobacteria bacterium]
MSRKRSRNLIFFFFAFFLITRVGFGFGLTKDKPLPEKWAKVTRGDIRQTIITTGVVTPEDGAEIKVGSRVSGKVEKLFVKVGDKVKRGDPIAVIEHADLRVKVEEREAALEEKRAELKALLKQRPLEISRQEEKIEEIKAQLAQAKKTYNRYKKLLPEKLIPVEDVDRQYKEVLVFKFRLAAAEKELVYMKRKLEDDKIILKAKIEQLEAQHKHAKISLGYAFIKSPIDGTVAKISTPEGETVAAQLSSPTFVWIIDLERLWVSTYVDETDIGMVKKGQSVTFRVDAFPGTTFHGKVYEIYPKAEVRDNMVTYRVIVKISDPPEKRRLLRPEMTAYTTIVVKEKKDAILVPVQAVKIVGGKSVVVVKGEKGPEKRSVTTGWTDSGKTEIRKGLKPGEEVLIQGFTRKLLSP